MWYTSEEKAREACIEKEKEFPNSRFYVLKDEKQPECWWAQRDINYDASPSSLEAH